MNEFDPENTVGKLAWHVHHSERLLEILTEPLSVRQAYIKARKPDYEVETRLRLLKLVQGPLPPAFDAACKAWNDARKAWNDAWKAWDAAWDAAWNDACKAWNDARDDACKAWKDALISYAGEIDALHKRECPNCPWDPEQKTIFPKDSA